MSDTDKSNDEAIAEDDEDFDEPGLISLDREILVARMQQAGVENPDEVINQTVSTQEISYRETYSGPLPRPEDIAAYEKAISGTGDRIFSMAEKEQIHRHKMEELIANNEHDFNSKIVFHAAWRNYIGQAIGGIALVLGMVIGGWLINNGKNTEGFVAILGPLATIIGIFVYHEMKNHDESNDSKGESEE